MQYQSEIFINNRKISPSSPTYFIADLAANHDGDLGRAKMLIWLAKAAGADAVKFQHFKADKIVSDVGFRSLGAQGSHQSAWKKSVYEVYRQYECNRSWTDALVQTAREADIDFFTSPYDFEAIDLLDPYLPAYKIGSGDITWHGILEAIAMKKKPVLLATGASTMHEVESAVNTILKHNTQLVLMQCNTNYTGSRGNFRYINLRVLQTFAKCYPGMVLGLSDHTSQHATVLGAIALGARVIEKHFTDDNGREGPDHSFALNPYTWKEMVERGRELEAALGDGVKRIEDNERETVVLQRRAVRLKRDMGVGELVQESDVEVLRPAPVDAFEPHMIHAIIGRRVLVAKKKGDVFRRHEIEGDAC